MISTLNISTLGLSVIEIVTIKEMLGKVTNADNAVGSTS